MFWRSSSSIINRVFLIRINWTFRKTVLVTITLFLLLNTLEATSESSYDNCDDQPKDHDGDNNCDMDKVLMMWVSIKLSQECLYFVPNMLLEAALIDTTAH